MSYTDTDTTFFRSVGATKGPTQSLNLYCYVQTPFAWLNVYPLGMRRTVNYVKDRYNNTPMFITENGKQASTLNLNLSLQYFESLTDSITLS